MARLIVYYFPAIYESTAVIHLSTQLKALVSSQSYGDNAKATTLIRFIADSTKTTAEQPVSAGCSIWTVTGMMRTERTVDRNYVLINKQSLVNAG